MAASADLEEFSSKFEREFSLIACLSSCSGSSRVWYIDSATSTHMSGVREVFSEIIGRDIDVEVELGDDRVVSAVGKGTVAFQGVSTLLRFRDVLCPGAEKESHFCIHHRGQRTRGTLQG